MVLEMAAALLLGSALRSSDPWSRSDTFAVVGLIDSYLDLPRGLSVVFGAVSKRTAPLLVQDKPWEFRFDNGYPNVIHDPTDTTFGKYRLWYHSHISGHNYTSSAGKGRTSGFLYANSSDGLNWEKPALGLYSLGNGSPQCKINPELCAIGTANNILNVLQGVGVMKDASNKKNRSQLFKAFTGTDGGSTRVSEDGLRWSEPADFKINFNKSSTGHWQVDCHNNMVWDGKQNDYLMTTRWARDSPSEIPRNIGLFHSSGATFGGWPGGTLQPSLLGVSTHQLYSQITFPFYNVYLGLVMVFDTAKTADGHVECRLAWSVAAKGPWHFVGGDLAPSPSPSSSFPSPLSASPSSPPTSWPQMIPRGDAGSFDSHIVFAAAHPILVADESESESESIRLYYMGGNGPHNGARNSSLGLATLRADGFIAVGGSGSFATTRPVLVPDTHATAASLQLLVTADMVGSKSSLRVGIVGDSSLSIANSVPVTSNATKTAVSWSGGGSLDHLAGTNITIKFELTNAKVYTIGFY